MLKKIETHSQRERKQRVRNTLIGIVIVALMVLSSIGYVIVDRYDGESSTSKKYNNYTFIQTEQGWQMTLKSLDKKNIVTNYLPDEVLNVNSSPVDLFYFSDKKVFVVISKQEEIQASYDLIRNLNSIVARIQFACSSAAENTSFCQESNLPIKKCEDADAETTIIRIDSATEFASYSFDKNCLEIKGQGSDITKVSDNFIFKLFKIME